MKLRAGKPLWLARRPAPLPKHRLSRNADCDVAIIGGGITGALIAYQLLQAGLRVTMLDKREPGMGSTAASTGLLLYQVDASIAELSERHGQATARRVYRLGQQAIRQLHALSRQLHLACDWTTRSTLYVASHSRDTRFVRNEARRTRELGFPARVLDDAALRRRFQLERPAGILSGGSAEIQALAFTRGLLRHCCRLPHFRLRHGALVRSLRETSDGVELRLASGARIAARRVIVAAGYEAGKFVRTSLVRLHSTYVIASPPLAAQRLASLGCLMWETARPYFYLRATRDRRIVFGGLDDPYTTAGRRDRRLISKTRQLEALFASLFPALAFRAEYAWTGTFADTIDGLPCIGAARPASRVLYALGYGGNGITFSQIAARILCDLCRGKPNADAKLFALDRGGHRVTEHHRRRRTKD